MEDQTLDCEDSIGVENLVFDENYSKSSAGKFCKSTTLPRSEVIWFSKQLHCWFSSSRVLLRLCIHWLTNTVKTIKESLINQNRPKIAEATPIWHQFREPTASMQTYQDNKMACFCNVLSDPLQLDGEWRVALAENTFPYGIKNVTTKDYFIYIPRTAKEVFSNLSRSTSASVIVQRPDIPAT